MMAFLIGLDVAAVALLLAYAVDVARSHHRQTGEPDNADQHS